jgi:competence protein ComEA
MTRINRLMAGLLCGLMLAASTGVAGAAAGQAGESGRRVNVNTANAEELASLPGIGPALAQAIIKQRTGEPFAKAEDLRKVKGIGDKLLERLKDQVTVGEPTPSAAPKGHGG